VKPAIAREISAEALREGGYSILAGPDTRSLKEEPLRPAAIRRRLNTRRIGHTIAHFDVLPSTNRLARELAQAGVEEGTVVIAEEQTEGRGRHGRTWISPAHRGLWFSVVLRPDLPGPVKPLLGFAAALAVVEAGRRCAGLGLAVKWPNDVYGGGKKLAGILLESVTTGAEQAVIVGIGVNVNSTSLDFPEELRRRVTSLRELARGRVDRAAVLCALLEGLERRYDELAHRGAKLLLREWRRLDLCLGRRVEVKSFGESYLAEALAVDADGSLLVRDREGRIRRLRAGEVSLTLGGADLRVSPGR